MIVVRFIIGYAVAIAITFGFMAATGINDSIVIFPMAFILGFVCTTMALNYNREERY